MRIDAVRELTPDDRDALVGPLDEHGAERGFVWTVEALALVLRDDAGRIVGGLIGRLHWGWLRIEILSGNAGRSRPGAAAPGWTRSASRPPGSTSAWATASSAGCRTTLKATTASSSPRS
jgi:hypothetical protein